MTPIIEDTACQHDFVVYDAWSNATVAGDRLLPVKVIPVTMQMLMGILGFWQYGRTDFAVLYKILNVAIGSVDAWAIYPADSDGARLPDSAALAPSPRIVPKGCYVILGNGDNSFFHHLEGTCRTLDV
jgi:hypothetical protein